MRNKINLRYPIEVRIMEYLYIKGKKRVSDIANELRILNSNISRIVNPLYKNKILIKEVKGREIYYQLSEGGKRVVEKLNELKKEIK